MVRRLGCVFVCWANAILCASSAHAAPVELFDGVFVQPGKPDTILAQYQYGGSGYVLSHDGGKTFGLVCSTSVDPKLRADRAKSLVTGTGAILMAGFDGLWRSDENGCNGAPIAELTGRYVTAITNDPVDVGRAYATTANGGETAKNGIFTNDGTSSTWTELGEQDSTWKQTIHVVKKDNGKRIWVTKAAPTSTMNPTTGMVDYVVHYFARFSDDDAKTWTEHEFTPINQFGPEDMSSQFLIIAIDPKNPDAIYGIVKRSSMPDDLVFSPSRGEQGTWMKFASVTELGGFAFGPDGAIYYSDSDQMTWGTYALAKPGDAPKQLNTWPAGCLRWDDSQKRMLACNRWQFGTMDLESGKFSMLYDMRCGPSFSSCANLASACQAQLTPNWCDPTHYPASPLCSEYDIPSADYYIESVLDFTCQDGKTVPKPEGGAGSGGSASATAGTVAAGSGGTEAAAGSAAPATGGSVASSNAGAPGTAGSPGNTGNTAGAQGPKPSSGGCSAAGAAATSQLWAAGGLSLLWFALRRRSRAARPQA